MLVSQVEVDQVSLYKTLCALYSALNELTSLILSVNGSRVEDYVTVF